MSCVHDIRYDCFNQGPNSPNSGHLLLFYRRYQKNILTFLRYIFFAYPHYTIKICQEKYRTLFCTTSFFSHPVFFKLPHTFFCSVKKGVCDGN